MSDSRPSLPECLRWTAYLAAHLRGQAAFPFRPATAIQRAQIHRVQRMVAHAQATVPYYRETLARQGLGVDDFQTVDDLARLPILERDQLQRDPGYFTSTARSGERRLRLRSGGSSGMPCTVYHDVEAIIQNAAHAERERSILTALMGRRTGYREAVLISPEGTATRVQRFLVEHTVIPRRSRIERRYISLAEAPEQMAQQLNEFRPDVVQGYGSAFEMLFAHLQATGAEFHLPKAITYSSDGLSDTARRLIGEQFGLPVFSTYQAIEAFKIGFECEQHVGLHLNSDLYPVRIVDDDGQPVPDGTSGQVLVSNLVNRATVLLNYRLGDIARRLPVPCPCGRTLPLLSFPEGRRDDILTLPSGRQVHPQAVNALFRDEQELWQYQIIQESERQFAIALVPGARCDRERTRARIASNVAAVFGSDANVTIAFVDAVERTPAGKVRAVIVRCPPSPPVPAGHGACAGGAT